MVETLVAATARVLVRDGYDRASTNRIAEAAGVSIGSLYQYFPTKEALVAALVERAVEEEFHIISEKMAQYIDAPLPVAVRALVEATIAGHRVNPRLRRVLTEEVPRIGALKKVVDVEERSQELLRHALQARRAELRVRDPALTAFILVHAVDGVCRGALLYAPGRIADARLVDELTDLVLRYVS